MRFIYLTVTLLCFHFNCHAEGEGEGEQWKTWKTTSQLNVSYREANRVKKPSSSGLIEIKANLTLDSTLSGFLLFLQDVENTPNWLKGAQESKIISYTSVAEQNFFVKFSQIWPLKPRLLLLHSRFWQNDDLSVDITVSQHQVPENLSDIINDKESNYLIVNIYHAHWKLMPIHVSSKGAQLNIEYTVIADGAGNAPTWLANHMALKSIWKSMQALEHQLPSSHWQLKQIAEIRELK